jgi:retron-type reverse transcriptase
LALLISYSEEKKDSNKMFGHKDEDPRKSFEQLIKSARRASKNKKKSNEISEFFFKLEHEKLTLQQELITNKYEPKPYRMFIISDPKVRKISKANFRDRVVHHAICNVLEPIFEKSYIYDSYACRKNKGNQTHDNFLFFAIYP